MIKSFEIPYFNVRKKACQEETMLPLFKRAVMRGLPSALGGGHSKLLERDDAVAWLLLALGATPMGLKVN
jgi:hypothetical protein